MKALGRFLWAIYVPCFYWWSVWTSYGILLLMARWHVKGRKNIPGGPLILASSHLGNVDPMMLAIAMAPRRRRIRFMAKEQLFRYVLTPFVIGWNPIRLYRGASDRRALRKAEEVVLNGELLGMFPEGTRSKTGDLGGLQGGTALIALRTNTAILPCRVFNTNQLGKKGHLIARPTLTIRFGKPFPVERQEGPLAKQVEELTERIREELEAIRVEHEADAA
ncbi:MAG: lysophospholipid acyltransferase family protein [Chloroflexi bacterium]|nr:lysophospholipid acyltransferase family protein [Chloroflexota bacterium]